MLTQEFGVFDKHRLLAAHGADDGRHTGVIAVANSDGLAFFEIDPAEMFDEGRDEMLAGLFAIADDIDAGLLLLLQ